MAIARVGEIYKDGLEKGYGTPMINVASYEMIKWAIQAAEEEGMPILIGMHLAFTRNLDMEAAYLLTKMYAERVKVPVAFHLDHTPSIKEIGPLLKFFDSVMVDGSSLPYEDNVRVSKEGVDGCKWMGKEVEADLGHVGSGSSLDDIQNADHYTNPQQAAEFVERTGCNSLAIAIGNAHGAYVAAPNLDFERLKEIRKAVDIPLVLHGGSGIPDEQFTKCAELGMSKFNIFTDYNVGFAKAAKAYLSQDGVEKRGALSMLLACEEPCREIIRHKIRMVNPKGLRVV